MLIKVFNQNDCDLLLSIGCKLLNKHLTSSVDGVEVFFNMYVPVELVEKMLNMKVNFVNSSRLTF